MLKHASRSSHQTSISPRQVADLSSLGTLLKDQLGDKPKTPGIGVARPAARDNRETTAANNLVLPASPEKYLMKHAAASSSGIYLKSLKQLFLDFAESRFGSLGLAWNALVENCPENSPPGGLVETAATNLSTTGGKVPSPTRTTQQHQSGISVHARALSIDQFTQSCQFLGYTTNLKMTFHDIVGSFNGRLTLDLLDGDGYRASHLLRLRLMDLFGSVESGVAAVFGEFGGMGGRGRAAAESDFRTKNVEISR